MQHDASNTYVLDSESATEMARLMIQDQHLTRSMGGLFPDLSDLSKVHRVLDLACGPGGWALEVAYSYPEKEITGVDISQQMIRYARAQAEARQLKNATFRVMNVLHPLDIPDHAFDLVNARFFFGFMPPDGWPLLLQECKRIVRPGGIIRLTEPERGQSNSVAFSRFDTLMAMALRRVGQSMSVDDIHFGVMGFLGKLLRDAGCTVIADQVRLVEFAVGLDLYEGIYQNYKAALIEIQPFLVKAGVATQEELDVLYRQAMAEVLLPTFCSVGFYRTVCGQTPVQ